MAKKASKYVLLFGLVLLVFFNLFNKPKSIETDLDTSSNENDIILNVSRKETKSVSGGSREKNIKSDPENSQTDVKENKTNNENHVVKTSINSSATKKPSDTKGHLIHSKVNPLKILDNNIYSSSDILPYLKFDPPHGSCNVDTNQSSIKIEFPFSMAKTKTIYSNCLNNGICFENASWVTDRILEIKTEYGRLPENTDFRVLLGYGQSKLKTTSGNSLPTIIWRFSTKKQCEDKPKESLVLDRIVFNPENFSEVIANEQKSLTVTFSEKMDKVIVLLSDCNKDKICFQNAKWKNEKTLEIELPEGLQASKKYKIHLGSFKHGQMKTKYGIKLEPITWQFSTE